MKAGESVPIWGVYHQQGRCDAVGVLTAYASAGSREGDSTLGRVCRGCVEFGADSANFG